MPGGATRLIDLGALDEVERIFALHCDPTLDVGRVGLREGPITGAADSLEVRLSGSGGHTSRPHLTEDLTFALAKIVTELPAVLSRRLDPRAGVSVVWGMVGAGSRDRRDPSSAELAGTVRMLDSLAWADMEHRIRAHVGEIVAPYGVRADVGAEPGSPCHRCRRPGCRPRTGAGELARVGDHVGRAAGLDPPHHADPALGSRRRRTAGSSVTKYQAKVRSSVRWGRLVWPPLPDSRIKKLSAAPVMGPSPSTRPACEGRVAVQGEDAHDLVEGAHPRARMTHPADHLLGRLEERPARGPAAARRRAPRRGPGPRRGARWCGRRARTRGRCPAPCSAGVGRGVVERERVEEFGAQRHSPASPRSLWVMLQPTWSRWWLTRSVVRVSCHELGVGVQVGVAGRRGRRACRPPSRPGRGQLPVEVARRGCRPCCRARHRGPPWFAPRGGCGRRRSPRPARRWRTCSRTCARTRRTMRTLDW